MADHLPKTWGFIDKKRFQKTNEIWVLLRKRPSILNLAKKVESHTRPYKFPNIALFMNSRHCSATYIPIGTGHCGWNPMLTFCNCSKFCPGRKGRQVLLRMCHAQYGSCKATQSPHELLAKWHLCSAMAETSCSDNTINCPDSRTTSKFFTGTW